MSQLPQHIHYWLMRQNKVLAAEVQATLPGHRAWVGIHPSRSSHDLFLIRYFEVDNNLIIQDLDIHEEQLNKSIRLIAKTEAELITAVSQWVSDLNDFKGPSFSDYPM